MTAVGACGNRLAISKARWARSVRPRRRQRPRPASGLGRGTRPLPQPVALARHGHDRGVGQEAIEDRRGGRHVAEKDAPVLRGPIRRNERRRGFVPADEDFQEVLRGGRAELLHPEILEDEQVDAREVLDEGAARPRRVGFREIRDEIEGAADQDPAAGADRADRDRDRHVRFPDARRPDEQDARVGLDEARTGELDEGRFRQLRIEGPFEIGERLHRDNAGLLEPPRKEPVGPTGEFVLDQEFEEFEVRKRRGLSLRDAAGERFDHAGETEMAETGRELGIHVRKSSKVYWVIGRIAGSSATSGGAGVGGAASTSRRTSR